MAIYHLSAQVISRKAGRSAVAAAAYRAGEKIQDERLGQLHDFSRKQVADRLILAPSDAPEWAQDRQRLWNEVERVEKRKDAQLCRELNVALPRELTSGQQLQLIKDYCQEQFAARGMVADITIHRNDPGNPHAHVMLTTRHLTAEGFGQKNRAWNDRDLLQTWREQWSEHANRALERAEVAERIDHRSFEAQGAVDRVPTVHEGPTVREMERRGIQTDRGELNRLAKEHNAIVVELAKYRQEKEALQERRSHLLPEERQLLAKAEKALGAAVTMESVKDGFEKLRVAESKLEQREKQFKDQLKPFEAGERLFREIEVRKETMGESSALKRVFNREEREKHRFLQERLSRAESELLKLGFKDREQFEIRKGKVQDYTAKELAGIEKARSRIEFARKTLSDTEKTLQKVEIRTVAAQYPEHPAMNYLSYPGAKVIKELNDKIGRIAQPKEIQNTYHKQAGQLNELNQKLHDINQTGSRLHGAHQWLEKYEHQAKQAGKLFQSPNSKAAHRQEAETSLRMMKEFGVSSREDYNRQFADHQKSLAGKPAIEAKAAKIQPGFDLLTSIMEAMKEASRRLEQVRAKEQWAARQRQRQRGHHRGSQEQDWGRER